jgi:hypothetical protein
MACFGRLPLRLLGGMQKAHSLVLGRMQAPQMLHRSWQVTGADARGGARPFFTSPSEKFLVWARSTRLLWCTERLIYHHQL